jgi:hypothetical protein
MELNELIGKEAALLPPTDTRWRPDQRALEEGRIAEAENIKLGVEQAQRDRRRLRENGEVSARESTTHRRQCASHRDLQQLCGCLRYHNVMQCCGSGSALISLS